MRFLIRRPSLGLATLAFEGSELLRGFVSTTLETWRLEVKADVHRKCFSRDPVAKLCEPDVRSSR